MSKENPASKVILAGARATAFGFLIRFGARIGFLFIAARLYGVALFGAYTLAVAAVEVGVTIGALGSKRILFKRLEDEAPARGAAHIVLDAAVLVTAVSLVLAGLVALAVTLAPEGLISPNVSLALVVLAPLIAGQALLDLLLAATRWTHAIRYEVVARSVIEPYAALAAALTAYALGWGESGLLASYWAGTGAALIYALAGFRRRFSPLRVTQYRFALGRVRPMLRTSAAATLNDVLSALFGRVDLYLVGVFLGEVGAGIYGMARQIRTPVRQVRQSFDGLLNPIIARTLALKGPVLTGLATASAARLILALQLPILILLVFSGAPLLGWFGPSFVAGYWALLLLTSAEMIQGAFGVSDLIILYRRPMGQIRITASNIAVNLAVGALLIGPLGVTGAALAVLAGVLAGALIRRHALRSHFGVRVPLHYSAGPAGSALLGLAVGWGVLWLLEGASDAVARSVAAGAGLLVYGLALKLWQAAAGERLSLGEFASGAASS